MKKRQKEPWVGVWILLILFLLPLSAMADVTSEVKNDVNVSQGQITYNDSALTIQGGKSSYIFPNAAEVNFPPLPFPLGQADVGADFMAIQQLTMYNQIFTLEMLDKIIAQNPWSLFGSVDSYFAPYVDQPNKVAAIVVLTRPVSTNMNPLQVGVGSAIADKKNTRSAGVMAVLLKQALLSNCNVWVATNQGVEDLNQSSALGIGVNGSTASMQHGGDRGLSVTAALGYTSGESKQEKLPYLTGLGLYLPGFEAIERLKELAAAEKQAILEEQRAKNSEPVTIQVVAPPDRRVEVVPAK